MELRVCVHACVRVHVMERCGGGESGGWRVLVSLKSVTHRIGMTSLPNKSKPVSASLSPSPSFSHTLSLSLSLSLFNFFFSVILSHGLKEHFSLGGFLYNQLQNRKQCSSPIIAVTFFSHCSPENTQETTQLSTYANKHKDKATMET